MDGIKEVLNTDTFDTGRVVWNTNDQALADAIDTINGEFVEEVLTGSIDNVNTVFITTYKFRPNSTQVWINGIKQKKNIDYSELEDCSGISFSDAPMNIEFNDHLEVAYRKSN